MKKFIEFHVLKNYGYTNLNRDAGGSPKTAYYGDIQRGRISSQCQKRQIRFNLLNYMTEEDVKRFNGILGYRTRKINRLVEDYLTTNYGDKYKDYYDKLNIHLNKIGKKEDKKSKKENVDDNIKEGEDKKSTTNKEIKIVEGNKTVQFYSSEDVKVISELIRDAIDNNTLDSLNLESQLRDSVSDRKLSLDIILFGRMAPTSSFSNVDGVMQVAHALSTHKIRMESDYFVVVDDVVMGCEGDLGAGYLDDFEYNSACYYEHMNFDVEAFLSHFGDLNDEEKKDIVAIVIKAITRSIYFMTPTGKQNSTCEYPTPSLFMVSVNDNKLSCSYSNAFIGDILKSGTGDIVKRSIECFTNEVNVIDSGLFDIPQRFYFEPKYKVTCPNNAVICDTIQDLEKQLINTVIL